MNDAESAELQRIIADGQRVGTHSLLPSERVIFLVSELDTSIAMHGIDDYFDQHRGCDALDAADALEHIGALESAALIREACRVFPGGEPPRDWEERRRLLSQLPSAALDRLHQLSDAYSEYPDDLGAKFEDFIRRHVSAKVR